MTRTTDDVYPVFGEDADDFKPPGIPLGPSSILPAPNLGKPQGILDSSS